MSVLSSYSVGSTRTLLFRHARVVGRPLRLATASHLVSHSTPEPSFKRLAGLTVYPVFPTWHLGGIIPLHQASTLMSS